ncbi:MAG TPA: SDR family oxidoreductase [Burkholderiales bacterium]|nr:SDR family oxidoreductase [Burkholderiales bacterium]
MRVVVTGASAGIGRATAAEFARRGARVALLARGEAGLAGASREVASRGGTPLPIVCDVADAAQLDAAAQRVVDAWGGIDVWVNNAMVTEFAPFTDMSAAEFRRVTEVTYLGAVWGTRAALRHMIPVNRGSIVQVGSALAYRSIPLQSAYCGAKSALRGFTDSVRSELIHARSRVHVTFMILSAFNTPQFDWARTTLGRRLRPVGKVFQPEVAARAIVWAARRRRREVRVGWPAVQAVVGTRLVPGFLDRMLATKAWHGQFTDEPLPPGRHDNLEQPVPADPGAHGRFDAQAHSTSWEVAATRHPALLSLALLAGAALLFNWRNRWQRRSATFF